MNKDEIKKYEIKRGLECCSAVDFETGCSDCPYRYRCKALYRDALNIITEQEKEIERLERECNQQAETLEIEKKNAVKEFSKKLKARITRFIGRHDLSVRFFNDIMSDLLKRYEK